MDMNFYKNFTLTFYCFNITFANNKITKNNIDLKNTIDKNINNDKKVVQDKYKKYNIIKIKFQKDVTFDDYYLTLPLEIQQLFILSKEKDNNNNFVYIPLLTKEKILEYDGQMMEIIEQLFHIIQNKNFTTKDLPTIFDIKKYYNEYTIEYQFKDHKLPQYSFYFYLSNNELGINNTVEIYYENRKVFIIEFFNNRSNITYYLNNFAIKIDFYNHKIFNLTFMGSEYLFDVNLQYKKIFTDEISIGHINSINKNKIENIQNFIKKLFNQ